ncbi:MAG: hypothetical protein AB9882_00645 [Ignavibacteriaceae bacterium]
MIRHILIILAIAALGANSSYADSTYISPSFYYTYGDYSNSMSSNSFAFFNTLQISERLYLLNSYDNLNIKTPGQIGWKYNQQLILGGLYYNAYPYFIKGNYAYILGKFNFSSDGSYNYNDVSHLFNLDFIYYQNLFYYGASYNYFMANGILNADSLKTRRIHQLTLRWEYIVSPDLFLSIKPNYTKVDDGRDLLSVEVKSRYLLMNRVVLTAGGFYGSRAYYFDSDLLTLFNQNYTQKYRVFGQVDFYPFDKISVSAGYQHTKFSEFSINYLIAGIKGYFWL